ncbi:zf-HC2 domain-containing protein [Undibacterium sp. RuRC25W]|uniref:zf-HC2 domain-containing protein n=1 Tax=Undibacterium sp. RuRC25W TaxID=3413047 RepID=UPI003BF148F9
MQFFLYSCKQAHRMISEGLDRPLRLSERARLKMHLSICNACTNFNGQMQFLRKAMHRVSQDPDPTNQPPAKPEQR